jgi:hypothetical protein
VPDPLAVLDVDDVALPLADEDDDGDEEDEEPDVFTLLDARTLAPEHSHLGAAAAW